MNIPGTICFWTNEPLISAKPKPHSTGNFTESTLSADKIQGKCSSMNADNPLHRCQDPKFINRF